MGRYNTNFIEERFGNKFLTLYNLSFSINYFDEIFTSIVFLTM